MSTISIDASMNELSRARFAIDRAALHPDRPDVDATLSRVDSFLRKADKAWRAYPLVELSLEESNTTQLIDALTQGTVDVAFIRPDAAAGDALRLRAVSEEPLLAALPAKHPAPRRSELRLIDLRAEPFILFPRHIGPSLFDTVVGGCRKAGFEPRLGQTAPHNASIVQLVAAELGVSVPEEPLSARP